MRKLSRVLHGLIRSSLADVERLKQSAPRLHASVSGGSELYRSIWIPRRMLFPFRNICRIFLANSKPLSSCRLLHPLLSSNFLFAPFPTTRTDTSCDYTTLAVTRSTCQGPCPIRALELSPNYSSVIPNVEGRQLSHQECPRQFTPSAVSAHKE